jgi:hypothetical protein
MVAGCRFAGCRLQVAGCRLQVAGCRFAGCRLQVAGCRLQVAGCRLQVAGCRLQVAGCRFAVDSERSVLTKLPLLPFAVLSSLTAAVGRHLVILSSYHLVILSSCHLVIARSRKLLCEIVRSDVNCAVLVYETGTRLLASRYRPPERKQPLLWNVGTVPSSQGIGA